MEKSIITTGKTIDLAIAAACQQLNMDRDSFSVEVIKNASRGFLGIGASLAEIRVTYEVPDEEPKAALSSASRTKPKRKPEPAEQTVIKPAPATKLENPKPAPKPADKPERPAEREAHPDAAPHTERPARPEGPKPRPERKKQPHPAKQQNSANQPASVPQPQKAQAPAPKPVQAPAPQPEKIYAPAPDGSTEQRIEVFVKGLLEHMGSNATPHASLEEDGSYHVELVGENLGALIGRRGDTLDAIQHLTNYTINRGEEKRCRITIDAENYRGKREESLQRLAQKMAAKAVRYRKNFILEPMNAYERHVIHAALQDTPNVSTYSTGTEPNRRIVIAYSRHKD